MFFEDLVESMKSHNESALGRIAWLYYDQGMSQQEIADYIGVSRLTINRHLKEARECGIVEFRIHEKHIRCYEIEDQLRRATKLDAVTVIPSAPDVIGSLGGGAVPRFKEALASCRSIALGGGRTILAMASRLIRAKRIVTEQIVSMGEFVDSEAVYDPNTIAHIITTRLNVKCHQIETLTLNTPLEVVSVIKDTPSVAKAIKIANESEVAFISACDVSTSDMIFYSPVSEKIRREILSMGVVGEIEGTLYTLEGKPHETIFSRRECVTFPMKCPVVMVSGGMNKVNAIVGAIRGGFVNELVTDSKAATKILEHF